MPTKLQSEDLGNGFKLVYQTNTAGGVRAVVKNTAGEIVARGDVVPEKQAEKSKRKAVFDAAPMLFPEPVHAEPEEETDFDEEDEDEEDEEEYL